MLALRSSLQSYWSSNWTHFGSPTSPKTSSKLLRENVSECMRLGDPFWVHFGHLLGPFWRPKTAPEAVSKTHVSLRGFPGHIWALWGLVLAPLGAIFGPFLGSQTPLKVSPRGSDHDFEPLCAPFLALQFRFRVCFHLGQHFGTHMGESVPKRGRVAGLNT